MCENLPDTFKKRHPEPRQRGRAVGYPFAPGFGANGQISARVGVRDLAFVVELNPTLANHKVPQGYSPAEESAGSLTAFGMTISSSHTPPSAVRDEL